MEFIEIEKIEEFNYDGDVMDLTVKDDESYNINGVVIHNSACTTYPTTGFGSRNIQASVVYQCSTVTKKYIVADGGIQYPADIVKSVVLGASMCMVGGMLSSMIDSPGRTVEQDGKMYKEFYGSASAKQSGKKTRIEGTVKLNLMKNVTLLDKMSQITTDIESAISYAGGTELMDLHSVKWI